MKERKEKVVPINSVADEEPAPLIYKKSVGYDSNGEIVYETMKRIRPRNGSGFVISYTEKMCEFLTKVSTGSIVRVFLYIAHHQNYGTNGVYGYRCTHKYLQQVLRIEKSTLWEALKYLKESFLINETKVAGVTEFMVNPNYVTIGVDKKARINEWNRRWQQLWNEGK